MLVAHSQGSTIAAATILQTDRAWSPTIGLLRFGCPLRRLYTKYFPAVVDNQNTKMIDTLNTVDCRILDAAKLIREPRGSYPPICGHSGFWTRDEFDYAVRRLLGSPNDGRTSAST